jgi:hypothetical protein
MNSKRRRLCRLPKADFSIIVLLAEKSPDFPQYIRMIGDLFQRRSSSFEFIIIANGEEGFLKSQLKALPNDLNIKAFSFPTRVAHAVCVRTALKEARSEVLVMCGSYSQITAESMDALLDEFDADVDLVCPWRRHRVDAPFKQLQSRIFTAIIVDITGSKLHDLNCNPRILRRQVLETVRLYGNLYRFLPILALQKGYRVREVVCKHAQERGQAGLYRFSEYLERLMDIPRLYFNTRFSRKPLRFFSTVGAALMAIGGLIGLWVIAQKIFAEVAIGNSPALIAAVILMVAGVSTAGLGLLGEIIAFTHGRQIKEYTIEKII